MQTNMPLAVEFLGSVAIDGAPAVMEGSNRLLQTKGGIISAGATLLGSSNPAGSAIFGRIMSVFASGTGADDSAFFIGYPTGSGFVVIGPLLNEQGVRENDPAKPNYLFNEQPCTVVVKGRLLYSTWEGPSTAYPTLQNPVVGCRTVFNNITGQIGFISAGGAVPAQHTQLQAWVANVYTFSGLADIDFLGPQAS